MKDSSTKNSLLKALILAGGRGKRLKEKTNETNKCMLKFGHKHLIEYSLENAVKLKINEIVIVVGYLAEQIINTFGNNYCGIKIKYVIQWEQKGLVDAIKCSQNTIDKSDFILLLGDEFLLKPDLENMVNVFNETKTLAVCGMIDVDDISQITKTYSILFDKEKKQIMRLIEKPKFPQNSFMGTGNIIFNNAIFNFIEMTPINQIRNEKELPDLIQCAIDDGQLVKYHLLSAKYVNVNTLEDITVIENTISE